jgi:hypothetical protein
MWTISLRKIWLLKMISKRDAKQEITCGLWKPRARGRSVDFHPDLEFDPLFRILR